MHASNDDHAFGADSQSLTWLLFHKVVIAHSDWIPDCKGLQRFFEFIPICEIWVKDGSSCLVLQHLSIKVEILLLKYRCLHILLLQIVKNDLQQDLFSRTISADNLYRTTPLPI